MDNQWKTLVVDNQRDELRDLVFSGCSGFSDQPWDVGIVDARTIPAASHVRSDGMWWITKRMFASDGIQRDSRGKKASSTNLNRTTPGRSTLFLLCFSVL